MSYDLERAHRDYPPDAVRQYLESHGLQRKGVHWQCVDPTHDDVNPSMTVLSGVQDNAGRVKCWSCGFTGDILDVAEALGDAGLLASYQKEQRETPWPRLAEAPREQETGGVDSDAGDAESLVAVLEESIARAIPRDHPSVAHLPAGGPVDTPVGAGPVPAGPADTAYWWRRGVSPATVQALGLVLDQNPASPHHGRHAIPYRDGRWSSRAAGDEIQPRWKEPAGPKTLWMAPGFDDAELVILCEGQSDAIAAFDCEFVSVSCNGATAWKPEWVPVFDGKRVLVCGDGDKAGRKFASDVEASLRAHRIACAVAPVPEGQDLAGLHEQKHLAAALRLWVKEADWRRWRYWAPIDKTKPLAVPPWLIQGVVPSGGLTLLYGDPGCGKSWLGEDMMAAVAAGRPWLGANVAHAGPTLILDAENPPATIWERQRQLGVPDGVTWLRGIGGLDDRDVVAETVELVKELRPVAIFFDSLSRLFPGMNEEKAQEVNAAFTTIQRICGGVAGVVLHHANKSRDVPLHQKIRGSTATHAAMDAAYFCCASGDLHGETRVREIHCVKMRQGREPAPARWMLWPNPMREDGVDVAYAGETAPVL